MGLVCLTMDRHSHMLNKSPTHVIQISPLKVNQSSFMLICLDPSFCPLFHAPAVVMQKNLCEVNQVVIKIFVNIKQFDTIHTSLVQVVAWLACQLHLFLLAP
jgi:hypothetical protein